METTPIAATAAKTDVFTPGVALVIADSAVLEAAIERVVRRIIAEHEEAVAQEADDDELVEQHDAAEILGKCTRTLRRWSDAGVIEAVRREPSREIYYRMKDLKAILSGYSIRSRR